MSSSFSVMDDGIDRNIQIYTQRLKGKRVADYESTIVSRLFVRFKVTFSFSCRYLSWLLPQLSFFMRNNIIRCRGFYQNWNNQVKKWRQLQQMLLWWIRNQRPAFNSMDKFIFQPESCMHFFIRSIRFIPFYFEESIHIFSLFGFWYWKFRILHSVVRCARFHLICSRSYKNNIALLPPFRYAIFRVQRQ